MAENKPKDIRKQEILDAAEKCFAEKGLQDTRIDDIALKAGLTKGGIYWHFRDKREIYLAMIDRHLTADLEFWEKIVSVEPVTLKSLEAAGILYIRYAAESSSHFYLHTEMLAQSFRDNIVKNKLEKLHSDWKVKIRDFIVSVHGSQNRDPKDFNAEGTACLLLSCLEGFIHQFWLDQAEKSLGRYEKSWIYLVRSLLGDRRKER